GASVYGAGLFTRVDLTPAVFVKHGAAILDVAPINQVVLTEADNLDAVSACPHLGLVRTLVFLHTGPATPKHLTRLLNSPHLKNLHSLCVCGLPLGAEGGRVLATSTTLPRLKVLQIGQTGLTANGARHLAKSPLLAQLEELNVWNAGLGAE